MSENHETLWLTVQDIARRYQVHPATVWRWLRKGVDFPRPTYIQDKCPRWNVAALEAFERRIMEGGSHERYA